MDHDEIVRLYGPWLARTPQDASDLMQGFGRPWWIAGGWAIEAFTGVARPHDDVDPSILRSDVHALREHLSGRLDVWQADSGTLRPLAPGEDLLSEECENLWLRPSGAEPWEYDVILMHATPTTWTFKRDARISLPLVEILWEKDGITYLRPEVQLLHKASALRPKDQVDFDVSVPLLDDSSRAWLRAGLELVHPGHPWLGELGWTPVRKWFSTDVFSQVGVSVGSGMMDACPPPLSPPAPGSLTGWRWIVRRRR